MSRENENAGMSFVYHKNHQKYKRYDLPEEREANEWFEKNRGKVTRAPFSPKYKYREDRAKRKAVLKKIHIIKGDIT